MTIERRHQSALVAAVALALTTGAVDAICFDRLFTVFPANQSGNAIVLGIALGHGAWDQAWRPALAVAGFALGVAAAALIAGRTPERARARWLLGVELALLAAVALAAGDLDTSVVPVPGFAGGALLLVASIAMGVQTMTLRRVAGVTVSTTYETGAISKIAEGAVRMFGAGSSASGEGARTADLIVVLSLVLAAYIAGAAVGAAVVTRSGAALALPIAGVALLLATSPRWSVATWGDDDRLS